MVRVLGWDMNVPGSIPADVNHTGYASDTSKSLGECLRLRSNHNLYFNGRLAESKRKRNICEAPAARRLPHRGGGPGAAPATTIADTSTSTILSCTILILYSTILDYILYHIFHILYIILHIIYSIYCMIPYDTRLYYKLL